MTRLGKLFAYAVGALSVLLVASAAFSWFSGGHHRVTETPLPVAPAVPTMPATPIPTPAPLSARISNASFQGDTLDECVDWNLISENSAALEAAVTKWRRHITESEEKDREVMLTPRQCAEQFAERIELASCTFSFPSEQTPGIRLSGVAHYYNVKTAFESGEYSKDCLGMGGDWHAAPKTDRDVHRERLRQQLNNALKESP